MEPIIQVNQLSFRYDERHKNEVLKNISFTIHKGERVAIIGRNGSGKSTLAKLLVGLHKPHKGKIYLFNQELTEETKWELRQSIGLVFQNPDHQFIGSTVQEDIAFGLENLNVPYETMHRKIAEVLEVVGMSNYLQHDPANLSGGQKQKIALAGILALDPEILILDESLIMLDPKSRRELLEMIDQIQRRRKITIVSITHHMNEVLASDRVIVLKKGMIEKIGTPEEIFNNGEENFLPFVEELRQKLSDRGRKIPQTFLSEEEMVNWLCE